MECIFTFNKFLIGSLLFLQTVFAAEYHGHTDLTLKVMDNLTIHGPANLHMVKAEVLEVDGPLKFSRLDVAKEATIHGPFTGDHGKFNRLEVDGNADVSQVIAKTLLIKGPLKAESIKVSDSTEAFGPFEVHKGEFQNVKVSGEAITLDDVSAENLTIGKSDNGAVLTLKGKTVIRGDILFESGNGIVKKIGDEVKVQGTIKGAKVE